MRGPGAAGRRLDGQEAVIVRGQGKPWTPTTPARSLLPLDAVFAADKVNCTPVAREDALAQGNHEISKRCEHFFESGAMKRRTGDKPGLAAEVCAQRRKERQMQVKQTEAAVGSGGILTQSGAAAEARGRPWEEGLPAAGIVEEEARAFPGEELLAGNGGAEEGAKALSVMRGGAEEKAELPWEEAWGADGAGAVEEAQRRGEGHSGAAEAVAGPLPGGLPGMREQRQNIRVMLRQWGATQEIIKRKQEEIARCNELVRAAGDIAPARRGGTEAVAAARRVRELGCAYEARAGELADQIHKAIAFENRVDQLLAQLSLTQQRVIELRYRRCHGNGWVRVARLLFLSVDHAKRLERMAVESMIALLEA